MALRSNYAYDADAVSLSSALRCEDPSLTQQHYKDETDVNVIAQRFGLTGMMRQTTRMPMYGDFTGITDYQSAIALLDQADEAFMQFPAALRARFNNDPGELLDFLQDPANLAEARTLGLVDAEPAPPATSTPAGSPGEPPKPPATPANSSPT